MGLTSGDLAAGRAVVTGGAGFLGSHLCRRLLKLGCEVVCVDNLITGTEANMSASLANPGMSFVRHDVSRAIEIDGPVDYVLHFASPASPDDYHRWPIPTLKVGSPATHNTLGLARAKKARFIPASPSEVSRYPDAPPHPATPSSPTHSHRPRRVHTY